MYSQESMFCKSSASSLPLPDLLGATVNSGQNSKSHTALSKEMANGSDSWDVSLFGDSYKKKGTNVFSFKDVLNEFSDLRFGYRCLQTVVDYLAAGKELQTKRMTSNLGPQKCRVLDGLTTLQSLRLGFVPFECDKTNQLKQDTLFTYLLFSQKLYVL